MHIRQPESGAGLTAPATGVFLQNAGNGWCYAGPLFATLIVLAGIGSTALIAVVAFSDAMGNTRQLIAKCGVERRSPNKDERTVRRLTAIAPSIHFDKSLTEFRFVLSLYSFAE